MVSWIFDVLHCAIVWDINGATQAAFTFHLVKQIHHLWWPCQKTLQIPKIKIVGVAECFDDWKFTCNWIHNFDIPWIGLRKQSRSPWYQNYCARDWTVDPTFNTVFGVCNLHIVVFCKGQQSKVSFLCAMKRHKQTLPYAQCIQWLRNAECLSICCGNVMEYSLIFDKVGMPLGAKDFTRNVMQMYPCNATIHSICTDEKIWRWSSLYGAFDPMVACSFTSQICTLHIKRLWKMCWIFQFPQDTIYLQIFTWRVAC